MHKWHLLKKKRRTQRGLIGKENCLKLRGLSRHANYTDRATAAGRRS